MIVAPRFDSEDGRRDAIAWIASTDDLVPRVPRRWHAEAVREHREGTRIWWAMRRAMAVDYLRLGNPERPDDPLRWMNHPEPYEGTVSLATVGSGLTTTSSSDFHCITANGAIAYHRDVDFPDFCVLLIVRPGRFAVTGLRVWRGDEVQPAGTMIGFWGRRRSHALVEHDTQRTGFTKRNLTQHARPPARGWFALTFDADTEVSPQDAWTRFDRGLEAQARADLNRQGEVVFIEQSDPCPSSVDSGPSTF